MEVRFDNSSQHDNYADESENIENIIDEFAASLKQDN